VSNVTLYGCEIDPPAGSAFAATVFGANITLDYCTIQPAGLSGPPVSNAQGYQYGIEADGSYYSFARGLTVENTNIWGFADAIDTGGVNQTYPQLFKNNYVHDARSASPGGDHTDGIGSLASGPGMSYVTLQHNWIVSVGNTNGIAFQTACCNDHFTITQNYLSGWNVMLHLGASGSPTNTTFTDNIWGTDIQSGGIQIESGWPGSNAGDSWRGNKIHYVNPITNGSTGNQITSADDGLYWIPDGNPSRTDYTG
jgi:hypothetical protein